MDLKENMYTRIVQIHINIPVTTQKHYSYIHIHMITITRFKKKMLLISLYVSKVMVFLIRSFTIAFHGIAHLTFWLKLPVTGKTVCLTSSNLSARTRILTNS